MEYRFEIGFYYVNEESTAYYYNQTRAVPSHFYENVFTVNLNLEIYRGALENVDDADEVLSHVICKSKTSLTENNVWQDCDSIYIITCRVRLVEFPGDQINDLDISIDYSEPDSDEEIMVLSSDNEDMDRSLATSRRSSRLSTLSRSSSSSTLSRSSSFNGFYDHEDFGYESDYNYNVSIDDQENIEYENLNDSLLS